MGCKASVMIDIHSQNFSRKRLLALSLVNSMNILQDIILIS